MEHQQQHHDLDFFHCCFHCKMRMSESVVFCFTRMISVGIFNIILFLRTNLITKDDFMLNMFKIISFMIGLFCV